MCDRGNVSSDKLLGKTLYMARRDTFLSLLALSCVLWTAFVAWSKRQAQAQIFMLAHSPPLPAPVGGVTGGVDTDRWRPGCLDAVTRRLVGTLNVRELSSPRQATAIWLAQLVLNMRVEGDVLVYGADTHVAAVLLFAVLMCETSSRQLWVTADRGAARDAIQAWSDRDFKPNAVRWVTESARELVDSRMVEGRAAQIPSLALLWCGGAEHADTIDCLRRGESSRRLIMCCTHPALAGSQLGCRSQDPGWVAARRIPVRGCLSPSEQCCAHPVRPLPTNCPSIALPSQ